MAKTVAITVHPASLGDDKLSVGDAMRQVLDFIDALEALDVSQNGNEQIIWRLQKAHTNSPPFTVVAEAGSIDPAISVAFRAERVTEAYHETMDELISGVRPEWLDAKSSRVFRRLFERNTRSVGRTDITFDDSSSPIQIVPSNARKALVALEYGEVDESAAIVDQTHTEYGAREGDIFGLVRFYGQPAVVIKERLSAAKVTCVLKEEVAAQLGPQHKWSEAWEGRRVLVRGALNFDSDGRLKKIDVESIDPIDPRPVSGLEVSDSDFLSGRSAGEHLDRFWDEKDGGKS